MKESESFPFCGFISYRNHGIIILDEGSELFIGTTNDGKANLGMGKKLPEATIGGRAEMEYE